jgi:hypothetical protein
MSFEALHSNESNEWYTPAEIIKLVRKVFPRIDLDPFSCEYANRVISATKILTKEDDAFECDWPEAEYVFVNPPGRIKGDSSTYDNIKKAWNRVTELPSGNTSIIWVGFSIEQLATLQDFRPCPLDFASVILRNRIQFDSQLVPGEKKKNGASHANYITLVTNQQALRAKFIEVFSKHGRIITGVRA